MSFYANSKALTTTAIPDCRISSSRRQRNDLGILRVHREMLPVKGSFGSPENAVGQGILRVHGEMLSVKESFGNKHLDHPGLALEHHAVIGAVNDSSVFFDNGFGIDKLKSVGLF